PATAKTLGVETGDVLRLALTEAPDAAVEAPVWVSARHAEGVVTLPLGYGRQAAGSVGDGVGFNAFALRTSTARHALQATRTGRRHAFAVTQHHATMEGRELVPISSVDAFRRNPRFATDEPRERRPEQSLYPEWE